MVEQVKDLADRRLLLGCAYCGGTSDTRDHVPSRAFLDTPYPDNLPVVGACRECNNGFSKDEEYLACLIEAASAGCVDPATMRRPSVARSLERSPALRKRIEAGKLSGPGGVSFQIESERVRRVLAKLATGHAAYELSLEVWAKPYSVWWHSIHLLSPNQREEFESPRVVERFGEIGSRGMQRLYLTEVALVSGAGQPLNLQLILNDWVEVQSNRYRYYASEENEHVCVRIVIGEYLASEVTWELEE